MNPFEVFDKSNLFLLREDDYKLALAGFPVWRAFISDAEADIWIEIIPAIDVAKKIIILPQKKKDQKQLQGNLFKNEPESDLKKKKPQIDSEVVKNFFVSIPSNLIESVSRFPDSHWELIKAVKFIGDDFISLLKTNPSLAYIIINMDKLNPSFLYYANIGLLQRMIRTKRKEILRLSGFPDTPYMIKIFSKIDLNDLDFKMLIKLKSVLASTPLMLERVTHILSFAKKINKNLLHFVSSTNNLLSIISDKLVFELSNSESYLEKYSLLQQMYKNSIQWKVRLPEIDSVENIDKLKKRFDEQVKKKKEKLENFPTPPLADSDFIIAIRTNRELISWSKRQQNCVRAYSYRVLDGRNYYYKVFYNGEEATLEIKKFGDKYRRGDLLGLRNCRVSNELSIIVKDWIRANNKK